MVINKALKTVRHRMCVLTKARHCHCAPPESPQRESAHLAASKKDKICVLIELCNNFAHLVVFGKKMKA